MGTPKDLHQQVTKPPRVIAEDPASAELMEHAGRYRLERKLGAGAMGEVYKAFDPDLGRPVALKFLRGDNPELLARFQQEAKAQARVDSAHICKVYEVGEADGRRYISMQYIAGRTLADAASEMNIEQKVTVLRAVAQAVHTAHKEGLIHRDLKPANIMVEKTESGSLQAYVMDFGLVRDQTAQGMTETGVVMGTLDYMAPEQLRGEVHTLDRRADVYSLGATLFSALSGRAPFTDENAMNAMMKILQSEPPSLTGIDRTIPPDLETIILKCLEKEPQRRYDSAKALAEDLQRYLDGEPILARRSSVLYRLKKKARKNKALVAVGSVAAVLLLVAGIYAFHERIESSKREAAARRFGQQIKEVESLTRISHLVPLHNTRPEKDLIRRKMAAIESEDLGTAGNGPAQYALGKGHLVLQEYNDARQHLQRAWDEGYQAPEVAYALGQVLGVIYNSELQQVQRLSSDEIVKSRMESLIKKYRDPALAYLSRSRGLDLEAPEYLEALLAFYEQRYADALKHAQSVYTRFPWMYEARELEGDIHSAIGYQQSIDGKYDLARQSYDRAEAAYQAAAAVGQSDSGAYERLANLDLNRIESEIYGQGQDISAYFDSALSAIARARAADPENSAAMTLQAMLYSRMGESQRDRGDDPRVYLQESIDAADQALKIKPDLQAYQGLMQANQIWATYVMDRGQDPSDSVAKAHEAYLMALKFDPSDPDTHNAMGICYRALGGYENRAGKDPRPTLRKAIDAYRQAIELYPKFSYPYNNTANTYAEMANYEMDHGMDPTANADLAIQACNKALEINPNFAYPYNNMATALNTKARWERQRGLDPTGTLQKAVDAAAKGATVKPNFAAVYANTARAYQEWADYECSRDSSPEKSVDQALQFAGKALAINPNHTTALPAAANADLAQARYDIEHGRDPMQPISAARSYVSTALKNNPDSFEAHLSGAVAAILEARWLARRHRDVSAALAAAHLALEEAIKRRPGDIRIASAGAELASLGK